jgi:hypothetical protein
MSDLICRKHMMRCLTPNMCSTHGGCPSTEQVSSAWLAQLRSEYVAFGEQNKALKAENVRLETERAELWRGKRDAEGDRDTKAAVVAELKAECEALRPDAERYRFVSQLAWYVSKAAFVYDIGNNRSNWATERLSVDADEVEAAIDETMSKKAPADE